MLVWHVLKSHYCKVVLLATLVLGYFLIPPSVWRVYPWLAGLFTLIMGLLMACTVRNIKERMAVMQYSLGALAAAIGLSAFQICVAGFCTSATIGLLAVLPGFLVGALETYSIPLILISMGIQLYSLYAMGCFKEIGGQTFYNPK